MRLSGYDAESYDNIMLSLQFFVNSEKKIHPGIPKTSSRKKIVVSKQLQKELDDFAERAKKLRGSTDQPPLCSPAFSLVRASVEFARLAAADTDQEPLHKAWKKAEWAVNKASTVLDRAEC